MRLMRWLLVAAACCLALPTPSKTPRPFWLQLPAADAPVAGHFPLKIGAASVWPSWLLRAPISAEKAKVKVTVFLDGSPFLSEEAPLVYDWDTSALSNGPHTLQMRWVDPVNQTEQALPKVTLRIANADRAAPPAAPPPPAANPIVSTPPGAPRLPGGANSGNTAHTSERRIGNPSPAAGAPGQRVLATLHAQRSSLTLTANPHPLETAHATALNLVGERLVIGLPNGDLTLYDCKRREGKTLHLPRPTGKVVAIQSDAQALYWLTEPAALPVADKIGAPTDAKKPAPPALRQLFVYRLKERELTGFYLAEANAFASTARLAPWQAGVALFAESASGLLDPTTGEIINLESQLPAEAAENVSRFCALYMATEGVDSLLVRADTHIDEADSSGNTSHLRLALWRWHDNVWTAAGTFLSSATDTWRLTPLAVTTGGVCSIENKVGLDVGLAEAAGRSQSLPLPFRAYFQVQNAQVALANRHLWTTDGAVLYHTDLEKPLSEAFLPWNEKGLRLQAFAPDRDGIWLATSHDVRHLTLNHPDPKHGYAGLLKFRLGPEAAAPPTPKDQQLAGLIAEWQGVPYLWGGSSKQGTDCSGFVMAVHEPLGVSLPRGTVSLRDCSKGQLVRDELQYGDVLVYPGHCAIYIGDGKTAETVDKAVSYASVWYHDEVVVRRFLHASQGKANAPKPKKR